MTNMITRRRLLSTGSIALGTILTIGCGSPSAAAPAKFAVTKTPAEWKQQLGAQRYAILREEGTERPYTSPLNNEKRRGTYLCAGCDLPLFASSTKFDSGTGWPSFYAAMPRAIGTRTDRSLGMRRVEEHCRRCGGHLGHIFDDGPPPTGKRHCINGLSLKFRAA